MENIIRKEISNVDFYDSRDEIGNFQYFKGDRTHTITWIEILLPGLLRPGVSEDGI